ncbi:hypothetical protein BDN72DRAFT_333542 [Pluteus cervinus]|uniref:Uncharacterized protein n=1 Tax=Pluteus cervinus TaxID=181527 RepID=A0ACD3ABW3_9AGAR|nr:hypothetical protein BDN72DRAFT_333542 [Pluteus cervinus]
MGRSNYACVRSIPLTTITTIYGSVSRSYLLNYKYRGYFMSDATTRLPPSHLPPIKNQDSTCLQHRHHNTPSRRPHEHTLNHLSDTSTQQSKFIIEGYLYHSQLRNIPLSFSAFSHLQKFLDFRFRDAASKRARGRKWKQGVRVYTDRRSSMGNVIESMREWLKLIRNINLAGNLSITASETHMQLTSVGRYRTQSLETPSEEKKRTAP